MENALVHTEGGTLLANSPNNDRDILKAENELALLMDQVAWDAHVVTIADN